GCNTLLFRGNFRVESAHGFAKPIDAGTERPNPGSDKRIHGLRDTLTNAILTREKEIAHGSRIAVEHISEFGVINGKRPISLKADPEIRQGARPGIIRSSASKGGTEPTHYAPEHGFSS